MSEKEYVMWLYSIPGIGDCTMYRLMEKCSAEELYKNKGKYLEKLVADRIISKKQFTALNQAVRGGIDADRMKENGIRFVLHNEKEFPEKLINIPNPPYALYVRGKLPDNKKMTAAIIGARECSEYGKRVARDFGKALAQSGIQLVSGMARGVDGIAQKEAVRYGGVVFAVLGSGADVCYPKENIELYNELAVKGGILSTYPLGCPPLAENFPPRNRIISGLADVILVVEARRKSGTMITVDMALEQGREVYVVPGRITDGLSEGCNKLISEGACIVCSVEEFLEKVVREMDRDGRNDTSNKKESEGHDYEQQKILRLLSQEAMTIEELWNALEQNEPHPMEFTKLFQILATLIAEGTVRVNGGRYEV